LGPRRIGTKNQNTLAELIEGSIMKKLNLICAALALAVPGAVSLANAAGIANSAHDWALESWNVNKDLCGPCHMAHGSDPNNQLIPLWSHQTVQGAAWQPFVSPHGTAIGQPDGASLACLSCHDGTLAYNQLKGQVPAGQTPLYVAGDYVIGNGALHDLRGDHPISFDYMASVTASPTNSLKLPAEVLSTTLPVGNNLQGQTVDKAFLKQGKLQCSSCHDVHRSVGDSAVNSSKPITAQPHNPLLIAYGVAQDGYGSALCRSCHNK
jgi:hypothetical protein